MMKTQIVASTRKLYAACLTLRFHECNINYTDTAVATSNIFFFDSIFIIIFETTKNLL